MNKTFNRRHHDSLGKSKVWFKEGFNQCTAKAKNFWFTFLFQIVLSIVAPQTVHVTGYKYKRSVEDSSFKIAEDVWLNQLHILNKRDGAHAHEHADSGYGAPPATYEEPAASYGAPAPTYEEPASGYGAPAPSYHRRSAEAKPEDEASAFKISEYVLTWDEDKNFWAAASEHVLSKRDGAHAHEHADSDYGAPPATYEEPAASYRDPTLTYKEPASRYQKRFAEAEPEAEF